MLQSRVSHVPSNLVLLAITATIEIEHAAVSCGRSVRTAVEPATVPVRVPDIDPSGSNIVQTPLRTNPAWSKVTVTDRFPVDALVNQPSQVPSSGGPDGRVGMARPPSPQPLTSPAKRTAPSNHGLRGPTALRIP